jgi:Uma2 family endonuclease
MRHDVAEPDLVVVTDDRLISTRGIEGVPVLLVEVLSPSTRAYDRGPKAERYAALGVPHFWLLDPDQRRLACHRLEAEAWRLVAEAAGAAVVEHPDWPGLTIRLDELWLG